jgi:phosphotransferase system HPr-like phosphotransfer protein
VKKRIRQKVKEIIMRIKLNTFENVNKFIKVVSSLESDILAKTGRLIVDAKSIMALYSLDLSKELELEVIEKKNGEEENLAKVLAEMDLLIKEI